MDEVDITNLEAENIRKLHKKLTYPTNYSLSKELLEAENELTVLKKKINLGNDLLVKVNDSALIEKLKKQKEEFEVKKNNLNILVEKFKLISNSIKDFTLFFIFIRRFYTLAILKKNFENLDKKISSKLINKLKKEEGDLYNEYIDGDCFSKVLLAFDFGCYQLCFTDYTKNFFENIQSSNDPYINSLLKLKALFLKCSEFSTDDFNLTELKFFLSKHTPNSLSLPQSNYELVGLRCFFFYELLFDFLKSKPVYTNLHNLKEAISLELTVVEYKPIQYTLVTSLKNVEESLQKFENKFNNFLRRKAVEDEEADAKHALVICRELEKEIEKINKQSKTIIENKYLKLEKMRRLLTIIGNETHLPKFLEIFNKKTGNDFLLNTIENSEFIRSNKEGLNFLFHTLYRDKFYSPLTEKINLFIKEVTEIYLKDDTSILSDIELKDLVEFSFYYLFSLAYPDISEQLSMLNNKLSYTEFFILNRFLNIKIQSLETLESKIKKEITKFIKKDFKNIIEYNQLKKNLLDEIKLNLETIQDLKHSLSEIKTLETSLVSKFKDNSFPMPEKTMILDFLESLEKKQEVGETEYQKIEKHKFNNKFKTIPEKKQVIVAELEEKLKIDDTLTEDLTEKLSCLTQNLSECLKQIKETAPDINRFRQKISSALGKLSSSMRKFLLSLNAFESTTKIQYLENLSLSKLLEIAERQVNEKNLLGKEDFKRKLNELQEMHSNPNFSVDFLINLTIDKYNKCNKEAKNILINLSNALANNSHPPQFFSKSLNKKTKSSLFETLSKEYLFLAEQANWLEKLFSLFKCETDDRILKLCEVSVEAEDYQKSYKIFNAKIKSLKKSLNNESNLTKQSVSTIKKSSDDTKSLNLCCSVELATENKMIAVKNLSIEKAEVSPLITTTISQPHVSKSSKNYTVLETEEKLIEKNNISESSSQKKLVDDSDVNTIMLLQDFEVWDLEFEKWKNEQNPKLYELFHIIESCSKSVLNGSYKAFLKCLSLYQQECSDKNFFLQGKKNQINFNLKNQQKLQIIINYLSQHQKWFDEIFQRIDLCRTLILQNENHPLIQESPRLPSSLADKRAEFNNLLTFYIGATNKYNKFRDVLISEENKLNNLNRNFIKLMLGSLGDRADEASVLSDFSKQLDCVNQLKLAIEQEFETKQKIKEKLTLFASPEIVKFYLTRVDPTDADSLKNIEIGLSANRAIELASYRNTVASQSNVHTVPATFYYSTPLPMVYSKEFIPLQPFYLM